MADINIGRNHVVSILLGIIWIFIMPMLTNGYDKKDNYWQKESFNCIVTNKYIDAPHSPKEFMSCRNGNRLLDMRIPNEKLYDSLAEGDVVIKLAGSKKLLVVKNHTDTLKFDVTNL